MGKIVLTFDLDNTIFNVTPLYKEAWRDFNQSKITQDNTEIIDLDKDFKLPSYWDYRKEWPKEASDNLDILLTSKRLTETEIIDNRLISAINGLFNHPLFEVYFITDRALDLYDYTLNQVWKNFPIMTRDRIVNSYVKKHIVIDEISKRKDVSNIIHFDDRPQTFIDCLDNHLPCVLISNENTLYNYDLSNYLKAYNINYTYKSLYEALQNLNYIICNTSTLWQFDTSLFHDIG